MSTRITNHNHNHKHDATTSPKSPVASFAVTVKEKNTDKNIVNLNQS